MEPLTVEPQAADHFSVSQRVQLNNNNNLEQPSSFSPLQTIVTHQIVEQSSTRSSSLQNDDHNLQEAHYSFISTPSLSPSPSTSDQPQLISSPPPLTSQDIAALRKTLSGRPKLRRVCQICGRECPSRHKLQRHLSTHSEERPYKCKVCGKAFKWTEYLSKHMRTQHGANSNVKTRHITIRSTGSSGSISSNEDLTTNTPTTPTSNHALISSMHSASRSTPVESTVAVPQNKTVTSNNSSSTGYNNNGNSGVNGGQSTPDVFSPQPAYDGILLTESVNSSTPLQASQSTPVLSTPTYAGGYFPTGFPYHPHFPMNCYGYPPTHMDVTMSQYSIPSQFSTGIYPSGFDPNYSNYMRPQPQELMDKGHSNHASPIVTATTPSDHSTHHSISSSVSCQTQETDMETSSGCNHHNNNNNKGKRPPVVIINMCNKKDVGIQCEVGDETLQALFEEEEQLNGGNTLLTTSGFDSNSSMDTSDEGPGSVCKYPCEYNGCTRSYVHRKDLIRHMKAVHRSIPKLLQPKVIETPTKPFICQVSDCGKSYFHLKDLRRHQRQCHLGGGISILDHTSGGNNHTPSSGGTSNNSSQIEVILDDMSSLRYPCDFKGCAKSYIHKKDLIRHKRTYHQDNSTHPSIPEPVIVIHIKKGKDKNNEEEDDSSTYDGSQKDAPPKRFRLDSSAEPLNTAQLPVSNQQPIVTESGGDLSCLNSPNILENISAAVANIFDLDRSPLNNMFPVESLTTPSSSGTTNLAISVNSTAAADGMDVNKSNSMYSTPVSSPSALFMTLLSQNI